MINWNHPITKRLSLDIPLIEGGGTLVNDGANKNFGTLVNTPQWNKDSYGKNVIFTAASSQYISFPDTQNYHFSKISCEIIQELQSTAANQNIFSQLNTLDNHLNLRIDNFFPAGQIDITVNDVDMALNYTAIVGIKYHWIITYEGTTAKFYLNGVFIGSISSANSFYTANFGVLRVGDQNSFYGNSYSNTKVSLLRLWNRILSPAEVKQLHSNPWQIYVQPSAQKGAFSPPAGIAAAISNWMKMSGAGQA